MFYQESSSFNSQNIADNPIWVGQIVNDITWKDNEKREKWDTPQDIPGFGSRYKVAIIGRHDPGKAVPDDQLEMSEVCYPVTAGSGHAGSHQTSNLRAGTFVIGTYKDWPEKREPIIIGCLGNNDQTRLASKDPPKSFTPFSAYLVSGLPVACYSMPTYNAPPKEGGTGSNALGNTEADKQQLKDGQTKTGLDNPSRCEATPLRGIQLKIQNLIKDLEKVKGKLNSWETAALKPIMFRGQQMSPQEYIQQKIADASKDIACFVKTIIDWVRDYVIRKVNNTLKDTYYLFMPNERPAVKKAQNKALELLSCLFNKIISNLLQMIGKFLLQCVDRFINTPLCAVENFIGGLLGKLGGLISGFVDSILGPIQSLVGSAFSLAGQIIGFLQQILGFFLCEETPACAEVKEWSIWDGAGTNSSGLSLNLDNVFNAAKDLGANIAKVSDPNNYDFGGMDFSDVFKDTCNVGPVLCGPPTVSFFGGGGSGAAGNAIIGAAGQILGVDITAYGQNYTSAPTVAFFDSCGKGQGAVGTVNIGTVPVPGAGTGGGTDGGTGDTTTGVVGVTIIEPGTGYIPSPDGSLGGDGRTWAEPGDTVVKHEDGTYDPPYKPGDIINTVPGDEVTEVGINTYRGDQPGLGDGSYPVLLQVCKISVINPGVRYSASDKVIVTPNNGIEASLVIGSQGTIDSIKVTNCGVGYTEYPEITIETETGYNGKLIPEIDIIRVGDNPRIPETVPSPDQIIHVIDCVGRI
jgi:hypothetical protein